MELGTTTNHMNPPQKIKGWVIIILKKKTFWIKCWNLRDKTHKSVQGTYLNDQWGLGKAQDTPKEP